ncbi:major facilitator superfamily domain-containing protein [Melampsora americana]|nr:major facilitator superfamily domain-containing protein [Melampsora americana]
MIHKRIKSNSNDNERTKLMKKTSSIYNHHHDHYLNQEEEEEEEKKVLRKLDFRILPLTALLYLSAYLDRGNLGNARLQGLQSELLNDSDEKFSKVLSAFFITYILLSIPGTLLAKSISPSKAISIGSIIWSISTTLISICNTYHQLIILRLLIGVGEALFGQSVALYYSIWYKKHEISPRLAFFIGAGVTAGGFGGLISYGISLLGSNTWRLLFLIEGIPSLLITLAILFCLPSRPNQTDFLNPSEKTLILKRLKEDGVYESGSEGIDWSGVKRAFTDWKSYTIAVLYSCMNLTLGSVSGFLPSIISSMGHEGPIAQLYSVPPYFVAFIVMTLISIGSSRYKTRAIPIAFVFMISSIGWMILLYGEGFDRIRYFATFLIVIGGYAAIPLIIGWVSNNTGSESQRAISLGMLNSIGQLLSILSSFLFSNSNWKFGFKLNLFFNLLAIFISILMRSYYIYENSRRDRFFESLDAQHDLSPGM